MNDWYIDRSKNFFNDTFDSMIACFASVDTSGVDSATLENNIILTGALGNATSNPKAAFTRFRDHGLLNKNNAIGDSALDYYNAKLSKGELVIDLLLKRPARKQNSPNVKPFIMLCKVFDIMMEISNDPDDIFLTFAECHEYLLPCDSYSEISYELVDKILSERNYALDSKYPIDRVALLGNDATNMSIWYNALKEAPVFMPQYEDRQVLTPNLRQREFFKFISVNADEFAETPTLSNNDLYSYYCKRESGLSEVLPKVIKSSAVIEQEDDIRIVFEYLFGYKKNAKFDYGKYLKYECFGIFFPFIAVPKLVTRHIGLTNIAIGDAMNALLTNGNSYLALYERGDFEYKGVFAVNTNENTEEMHVECEKREDRDYSIEELGDILLEMYNRAINKPASIHIFGIKYANVIYKYNYSLADIISAATLQSSYKEELRKGLRIYDSLKSNEFGLKFAQELGVKTIATKLPEIPHRSRTKYPLNCILYGAPGTGKTYSTAQYAVAIATNQDLDVIKAADRVKTMKQYNELIQDGRIVFTTFHQNYGYEDFIQGIRPDTSSAEMAFVTVDGVFKEIANCAILHPEQDYIIIIDEINRANISKVFGELITLIEDDKRWGETNAINVTLPSGEEFAVPNNLYIIGTMNSADKSISLIDTALRRRFDFVEFEPDATLIADADLRKIMLKLNKGIADELGSTDLLIGHSYFLGKTLNELCEIMNRNIIPLLYEYFFDNQKKVEAQVKYAVEGYDFEIKNGNIGRIKLVRKVV